MRNTLQEQYNSIKEGKGAKDVFVKHAKSLFPHLIPNHYGFDNAATILTQRGIISENLWGVTTGNNKQPDWFSIFNESLEKENKADASKTSKEVDEYKDKSYHNQYEAETGDDVIFDQYLNGIQIEVCKSENAGKTIAELKKIVLKNLKKDKLYYTKNAAFGVEGIGYTDEAPGLGKTKEVKGKYASSGMEPVKLKESLDEIGMFHDPRTSASFKDDDDKWENGAFHVRFRMLKNKGIDADKAKELAATYEDKSWEEVKKLLELKSAKGKTGIYTESLGEGIHDRDILSRPLSNPDVKPEERSPEELGIEIDKRSENMLRMKYSKEINDPTISDDELRYILGGKGVEGFGGRPNAIDKIIRDRNKRTLNVNESKLRSAIRSLIKEELNLKEIDQIGEEASKGAKVKKINDEINKRKKKIKALETLKELEDDSINPKKLKELYSEIKKLEAAKTKLEKKGKKKELLVDEVTVVDKTTTSDEVADIAKQEKTTPEAVKKAISTAKTTGEPVNVA